MLELRGAAGTETPNPTAPQSFEPQIFDRIMLEALVRAHTPLAWPARRWWRLSQWQAEERASVLCGVSLKVRADGESGAWRIHAFKRQVGYDATGKGASPGLSELELRSRLPPPFGRQEVARWLAALAGVAL